MLCWAQLLKDKIISDALGDIRKGKLIRNRNRQDIHPLLFSSIIAALKVKESVGSGLDAHPSSDLG